MFTELIFLHHQDLLLYQHFLVHILQQLIILLLLVVVVEVDIVVVLVVLVDYWHLQILLHQLQIRVVLCLYRLLLIQFRLVVVGQRQYLRVIELPHQQWMVVEGIQVPLIL